MNKHLRKLIIAPITSKSKPYPSRVEINLQGNKSWVVLDQIRTIDKQRIVRALGQLSKQEIKQIKAVIKEAFVD
jgi:mRNA interferase MazF